MEYVKKRFRIMSFSAGGSIEKSSSELTERLETEGEASKVLINDLQVMTVVGADIDSKERGERPETAPAVNFPYKSPHGRETEEGREEEEPR